MSDLVTVYCMFGENPPDHCERMISALQFISSDEATAIDNDDSLYNVSFLITIGNIIIDKLKALEKGPFYRGMVDNLAKNPLISQVDILLNKFSEFERFHL
jgi:hypothetical protein